MRNRITGLFLGPDGEWTDDFRHARAFDHGFDALRVEESSDYEFIVLNFFLPMPRSAPGFQTMTKSGGALKMVS